MEPNDQTNMGEQNVVNTSDSDKKKVAGWLLLGLLLVVVGITTFFYLNVEEKDIEEQGPFSGLSGSIYLSMVENGQKFMDIYVFDIVTSELDKLADDSYFKYTGHLSPNGSKIVYTGARMDRGPLDTRTVEQFIQVYIRDLKMGTFEPITSTLSIRKRLTRWSPDDTQIAYMTYSGEGSAIETNSWDIHIVDFDGVDTLVSQGVQPIWSPDGSQLLFLKNDGLHVYNIEDESIVRVIELGGTAGIKRYTKYNVSNDGRALVFTSTNEQALLLYTISSWKPFKAEFSRRIAYGDNTTSAAWPVFSPDDRYLALQVLNRNTGIPRVDIYELETFARKELIDLSDYKWTASYVTDWR